MALIERPDRGDGTRRVLGAMTGTSLDGIDVVAARIEGAGLALRARLERHLQRGLGDAGPPLRRMAEGHPLTAGAVAELAWSLGERHAAVLDEARGDAAVDLAAVHGQTVFHDPPHSLQLINPAPIAARLGCPVVSDLRQADLAAGGQGAPITPLADWVLFRAAERRRAVVNLGGFCNVTLLPRAAEGVGPEAVRGFDLCACNQVLDAVARRALAQPFDREGAAASRGSADGSARAALLALLRGQRPDDRASRSLGTGDEAEAWVDDWHGRLAPDDLAATAVTAVGERIAETLADGGAEQVVLAGGGTRNAALRDHLARALGVPVTTTEALGVAIDAREALAMAVLGALSADGVPITLPQVTGCRAPAPLAGTWTFPAAAASPRAT